MNSSPACESNKLSISVFPDKALSVKAQPVQLFDSLLTQKIIDMYGVLNSLGGMGLSACQVGSNEAMFVVKTPEREGVFINPTLSIIPETTESEQSEGCLSIPGVYVKVKRPDKIKLDYVDESNVPHSEEFTGLLARCIQHEMDHLNGKTIIEYLSRLKRDMIKRKMKKFQKTMKRMEEVDKNARQRALRVQTA